MIDFPRDELVAGIVGSAIMFFLNVIYIRLPHGIRGKLIHLRRKILLRKVWKKVDRTQGIQEIVAFTQSRTFLIRIGKMNIADNIYRTQMNMLIEAEHIWDWHIFLDVRDVQQGLDWMTDFYAFNNETQPNALAFSGIDEDNATTQVGLIDRQVFAADEGIVGALKMQDLDADFDELIIYGHIRGLTAFPRLEDLAMVPMGGSDRQGATRLKIDRIKLFYHNQNKCKVVDSRRTDTGSALIKGAARLYDKQKTLYIDDPEKITESDREKAMALAEHLIRNESIR